MAESFLLNNPRFLLRLSAIFIAGEAPIFKEGLAQFKSWLSFHKEKWKLQKKIRQHNASNKVFELQLIVPISYLLGFVAVAFLS